MTGHAGCPYWCRRAASASPGALQGLPSPNGQVGGVYTKATPQLTRPLRNVQKMLYLHYSPVRPVLSGVHPQPELWPRPDPPRVLQGASRRSPVVAIDPLSSQDVVCTSPCPEWST